WGRACRVKEQSDWQKGAVLTPSETELNRPCQACGWLRNRARFGAGCALDEVPFALRSESVSLKPQISFIETANQFH
ncbi:MAG: hypothetical protein IJV69_06465, partial [Kiritimatiellae bacterium]|nr:hypothetical protein [Kiritimatiellia bacterium]